MSDVELTAAEARRIQLRAQGLLGAEFRRGGVPDLLSRLGAVQLDTISVLARSHELIPYARLGAVGRDAIETAYWGDGGAFEYWAHAACVLPMQEWPHFEFRREAYRQKGWRWHKVPADEMKRLCEGITGQLRADGPLTTKELGGAKKGRYRPVAKGSSAAHEQQKGADWWEWSDTKIAIEWLLDVGDVVCVRRTGWRRVYDLAERAVPADLLAQRPDEQACLTRLVGQAGRALGVATRADLADYYRIRGDQVDAVIEATGMVPVRVAGWKPSGAASRNHVGGAPAWADPAALESAPRGRHATTLLSPFDSLVWDRARTSRMFGFDHRLEAYVPKAKRVHGYFTMPLLAGGRLIGRVDPAREKNVLVAKRVSFEPREISTPARAETAVAALRTALWQAAGWVGCDDVRVDIMDPPGLRALL